MKRCSARFWLFLLCLVFTVQPARAAMDNYPIARLRMLDKITARTSTFNVMVGTTVRFGQLYIKPRACRKAPPIEKPESASFLQIWEITPKGDARWVFSGWMFASSPALSSMDHPVYDVWVLDCVGETTVNPWPMAPAVPAPNFSSGAVGFSSAGNNGQIGFTSASGQGAVGFNSGGQKAAPVETHPDLNGEVKGTVAAPAGDNEGDNGGTDHSEDGSAPEAAPPPAPPVSTEPPAPKSDEVSPDAIHDPVY